MTVLDMLARTGDLEAALLRLVTLLQADELDQALLDQLDEATRDAGRLLADADPPRAVAAQPARQPPAKPDGTPPAEKHCPKCDTTKPAAEWNRNRSARDGLQSYCRACQRADQKVADTKRRKRPPEPSPPAGNGSGVLDDAERERLRRRASKLRDSDPAEAKRLTDRLYGITA